MTTKSWPFAVPFTVLRRAYHYLNVSPWPSTRVVERSPAKRFRDIAKQVRRSWADAVILAQHEYDITKVQ